ncbi:MAG: OmpA family protein [Treponema sp.]|jgi:outer membrane protein OmpA-like peptidoglycan-associated protein|nr:OmpA family protein [Treponema sp.]
MKKKGAPFKPEYSMPPVLLPALLCVFLLLSPALDAEQFLYKHETGDTYRILSTVNEDVYINRRLSHQAEILNRIAVEVQEVKEGKGRIKASFLTAERALALAGRSFQWSREYESEFERDEQGHLTIGRQYYMPVVRDVPVFPSKDIKAGESWSAEGHEMHDFRDGFGIQEPYLIPFTAQYTFLGTREWKDKDYPAFSVTYRIFTEPAAVRGSIYPTRIMGASDQTVYWDTNMGQAVAYEENFRMIFELSNNQTVEYRGWAKAEVLESQRMDREKIKDEIKEELERLDLGGISVRDSEEGIVLNLENIQFYPDSPVMLPGEQQKLDKIAEILMRYGDRDILVGGHTALAGNPEGRMKLSLDRAGTVADYLIDKKVRGADRVVVRGYGAEKPIADNLNETGRARNRRVEITILEN